MVPHLHKPINSCLGLWMHSRPCLEREKRLSLCPVHALWCYVECTTTHSYTQLHTHTHTVVVCKPWGQTDSVNTETLSLTLDKPPPALQLPQEHTQPVLTEGFIQWNKWKEICARTPRSTLGVVIGFSLLDVSGLCSLVTRTGLSWTSCWIDLVFTSVNSRGRSIWNVVTDEVNPNGRVNKFYPLHDLITIGKSSCCLCLWPLAGS